MADSKLSALPSITPNDATLFYGVNEPNVGQGKITGSQLKAYASGSGLTAIAAYSALTNNTNAPAVPSGNTQLILGAPVFTPALTPAVQLTGAAAGTYQVEVQNTSTNVLASTDIVATANTGTDTTQYIDIGVNNSTFSDATWTINGALDGYLYTSDGELAIGTATNKALDLFTGGTLAANKRLSISGSGAVSVPTALANALTVGNAANPALTVDSSTASSATGWAVKSAAAAGGVSLTVTSSGTNEPGTISSKGTGNLTLAGGTQVILSAGGSVFAGSKAQVSFQGISTGRDFAGSNVPGFLYTLQAASSLGAGLRQDYVWFNLGATQQHSTGAIALLTDFRISGANNTATAASTFTDVAAFSVDLSTGTPTNVTRTNVHNIYIPTTALAGTVMNSYGLTVNANTGAPNNYAAQFNGGVTQAADQYVKRTPVSDVDYTALEADYIIAYTALTANRNISITPGGSSAKPKLWVLKNETSNSANTLTLTPTSGTFDGGATAVLAGAYSSKSFYDNGTNFFMY